jgi:hypothetical protein
VQHIAPPYDELPHVDVPWQFISFKRMIVAASPSHPPMGWMEGYPQWKPLFPAEKSVLKYHTKWFHIA